MITILPKMKTDERIVLKSEREKGKKEELFFPRHNWVTDREGHLKKKGPHAWGKVQEIHRGTGRLICVNREGESRDELKLVILSDPKNRQRKFKTGSGIADAF